MKIYLLAEGKPPKLGFANINIPNKPHCKYLGVYLARKPYFREHINYMAKKLNGFCGLLYRVSYRYPVEFLLSLNNSYAKSIINYGLLIYENANKCNLQTVHQDQRRILRATSFKSKSDTLKDVYKQRKI